jgi:hypothetical protein
LPSVAQGQPPSGEEVLRHCDNKPSGQDQWTTLTVINRNPGGEEKKYVYRRLVKNYEQAADQVIQKMLLVTEFPPDGRDTTFMRWEYIPGSDKVPEQWLYAPQSAIVKRIAERDPTLSFLGSTLTLGDMTLRTVEQDTHTVLGVERTLAGEVWLVESVPKSPDPQYSKRITRYLNTPAKGECMKVGIVYYDTKGLQLKTQDIAWQQVNGAWLWSHVEVKNLQTQHVSTFDISDAKVNTGIGDELFSERTLKRGLKAVPKR